MFRAVDFQVTPTQYEEFRLQLDARAKLEIRLFATHKVNLLILDGEQMYEYAYGHKSTHEYEAAWSGVSDLKRSVTLKAGRWHLLVEGHTEKSRGRIIVST